MKVGKISESVLDRSVLKILKNKRKEVISGAKFGKDSAVIVNDGKKTLLSTEPIILDSDRPEELSFDRVINNLCASGAEPVCVMLHILLPIDSEEKLLKDIMKQAEKEAEKYNVQISGGHTEVTAAVNKIIVTATGMGKAENIIDSAGAKPGDDVVITKWVGLKGTVAIAKEKEEELLKRFSMPFLLAAKSLEEYISVVNEAAVAVKSGANAMHDASEGGIFGALWELSSASGVGLEIDLKEIPIRQETIEVCEAYGLNPYEMISNGSLIITTEKGHDLVRELKKEGIHANVVGKVTKGNDRILINGDETRFLEPSKSDEIYKL